MSSEPVCRGREVFKNCFYKLVCIGRSIGFIYKQDAVDVEIDIHERLYAVDEGGFEISLFIFLCLQYSRGTKIVSTATPKDEHRKFPSSRLSYSLHPVQLQARLSEAFNSSTAN